MWLQTYRGKKIYIKDLIENPSEETFDIRDIAHALGNSCRYNGHVLEFYSVAEHCCIAHDWARALRQSARFELMALLHDAGEVYYGDLIRPWGVFLGDDSFKKARRVIQQNLWKHFHVEPDEIELSLLEDIDISLLWLEKDELFADSLDWDLPPGIPYLSSERGISCWSPEHARREYLTRFRRRWNELWPESCKMDG